MFGWVTLGMAGCGRQGELWNVVDGLVSHVEIRRVVAGEACRGTSGQGTVWHGRNGESRFGQARIGLLSRVTVWQAR